MNLSLKLYCFTTKEKDENAKYIDAFRNLNYRGNRDKEGNLSQLPDFFWENHRNNGVATTNIHSHHPKESAKISGGLQNFPTQNSTILDVLRCLD